MKVVLVELINPSRSYFAGQVVQGRVIVQNDKPLKIKEVTVLIEGKGRVHWSETETYTVHVHQGNVHHHHHQVHGHGQQQRTHGTRTQTRLVNYSSTETYVSQKISLAGDGHNLMELAKGTTIYPFQFVLPRNCPSSFTSRIGLVSYFIEAEVRRPMLKPNKRMAVPITVNGIFDLNMEFGATQPQQVQQVKGSNFFACRKGQLGFILKIPRSGFVSGEILPFSSEVTNSSNRKVNEMKATLSQITQFHAQGKTKTERKVISQVKGPEVDKGDHEMWMPFSLNIPPLPPTRLGGLCRIIDVQYFVQFELNIAGLSSSLCAELPIMIGTIPLRSTFDDLRYHQSQITMPQNPSQPQVSNSNMGFHLPGKTVSSEITPAALPDEKPTNLEEPVVPSAPVIEEYPDLPPPTYAEAVLSEQFAWNHDEDNKNLETAELPSAPPMSEYVPNYVTYKSKYE